MQAQTRTSQMACKALQTVRESLGECLRTEHVVDLLREMLHEDPAKRLTSDQILSHSFLTAL